MRPPPLFLAHEKLWSYINNCLDIPLPTAEDREQLLKINLREVNVDADVILHHLAELCEGYPIFFRHSSVNF